MIESFPGDIVKSNSTFPKLKRDGECFEVLVTAKDGEWLTVTDGKEEWRISWYTVFLRTPKKEGK